MVRLHPLRAGILNSPPGWFVRPEGRLAAPKALGLLGGERARAPVPAFLLEHPDQGPVLVDTGLDPAVEDDLAGQFGRLSALAFKGMKLDPAGTIREQVRARGVDPEAIRTILMTHLHVDHASGLKQFPGTTVMVSRREWEAAQADGARSGYRVEQLDADVEYRMLDVGAEDLDVFGDGSVIAISTPGHTHGHLSLEVATQEGPVLIAGDAIYTLENLEPGREPFKCEDRRAWRDSVAKLRAWRDAHPGKLLIPGHDAAHWDTVKAAY